MQEYFKNFDKWNSLKKELDARIISDSIFPHEQEIWWCSLGVNVGSEQDGKNELFERPVLVLKRINKDLLITVSLTSKIMESEYRIVTESTGEKSDILLSHIRTLSSKRFMRRVGRIKNIVFQDVIIQLAKIILGSGQNETPL